MKITKTRLKQIIKEEITIVLEGDAFAGLGGELAATGLGALRKFQQFTGIGKKPWTHKGTSNRATREVDKLLQYLFEAAPQVTNIALPITIVGELEVTQVGNKPPGEGGATSVKEVATIKGPIMTAKIVQPFGNEPSIAKELTLYFKDRKPTTAVTAGAKSKVYKNIPLTSKGAKELGTNQSAETILWTHFQNLEKRSREFAAKGALAKEKGL